MRRGAFGWILFAVLVAVLLVLRTVNPPAAPKQAAPKSEGTISVVRFSDQMVKIPGGTFLMGSSDGPAYERPVHEVTLSPFYIDKTEVTVGQFRQFVAETKYVTDAEKFGWSGVFDVTVKEWAKVDGANWRQPMGPGHPARDDEPVMQVSWRDAQAFAKWAGKRLPTEAEWEFAARGGLAQKTYVWGDELTPGGKFMANFWQGDFPGNDQGEDGVVGVAVVGKYPANGYGVFDMTGNVWEWCEDNYSPTYYAMSPKQDPKGPSRGEAKVMRGGSWMCARNFCTNYRVAGRSSATVDSGLNNLGFRCARSVH